MPDIPDVAKGHGTGTPAHPPAHPKAPIPIPSGPLDPPQSPQGIPGTVMGYTPTTPASATLIGLVDPNGGTLYTDTLCTTAATAAGQVVRGNKDALSGNTGFTTAVGNFSATLQTAAPGFKYVQFTTNSNATQGCGLRFNSGLVDPANCVLFLLHAANRNWNGASDLYCDIGNSGDGTGSNTQVAHSTSGGRPSYFNGATFASLTALMNMDVDYSTYIVKSESADGNGALSRDLEQGTTATRATTSTTLTGWSVYCRNNMNLFGGGKLLLAELFAGPMSDAEIAAELTSLNAYRASLGTPNRVTGANAILIADGDSNAVGIGSTAFNTTWISLLGDRVAASAGLTAGVNLFARNVGASTRQFTHLSAYSATTIAQLNAATARAVYIVHCGENDAQNNTAQTVFGRLTAHLQGIRAGAPQAVIGICTLPPRGDNAAGYEGNRAGYYSLIAADPSIGGLCDFVVDITNDTNMGLTGQTTGGNYYTDNIHYAATGHLRIVDLLTTTPMAQCVMPFFAVGTQSLVGPGGVTALTVTGGQVIALTASVTPTATAPKNVTFSVGQAGGTLAPVTATGSVQIPLTAALFTAPAATTAAQVFVVTATNMVAGTAVAFATITVQAQTAAPTAPPDAGSGPPLPNIGIARRFRRGRDEDEAGGQSGLIRLSSPGIMSHGPAGAPTLGTRGGGKVR